MPHPSRALPIYLRIVDSLRDRITGGELRPGDRLPSEAELSAAFKTTRATVARGLRELVYENLITREVGRGSFVAHPPVAVPFEPMNIQSLEEQVVARHGTIQYRLLDYRILSAPKDAAAALGLKAGTTICRIERLRLVNGLPLSLVTRYVERHIGETFSSEDLNRFSVHEMLSRLGRPVLHTDGWISVTSASARVGALLAVKPNAPMLKRTYTLRGADREPLVFGRSLYREEFHITYGVSAGPTRTVPDAH